jgi:biotin transport system substrate-specific component
MLLGLYNMVLIRLDDISYLEVYVLKPFTYSPLRSMVYASLFGALTAIGAFIVVPLQPVPFTLQTFFTALSGVILGGRTAALSQVVYLILGCMGLPVFAGGKAGLGIVLGPTGGYILGFILGAYIIGKIVEARAEAGIIGIALAILAGDLIIYGLGTLWLSIIAQLSLAKAFLLGVVPFLLPELLKLMAAAFLAARIKRLTGENDD